MASSLVFLKSFLCDIGEFVFEGGIADFSTEEGFKITSRGLAVKEEGFLPFSLELRVISIVDPVAAFHSRLGFHEGMIHTALDAVVDARCIADD